MFCFVLFCFILFCFVEGQNTWNVKLPYSTSFPVGRVKELISTQDKGYIALIAKFTSGQHSQTLYKYSENGQLLWEKNYNFGVHPPPPPGANLFGGPIPLDIIEDTNGELVVIGNLRKDFYNSDAYYHRMSNKGDSLELKKHEEYRAMLSIQQEGSLLYVKANTDTSQSIISLDINNGSVNATLIQNIGSIYTYINIGDNVFVYRNSLGHGYLEKYNVNNELLDNIFMPSNPIKYLTKSYDDNIIIYSKNVFMKLNSNLDTIWHYPASHIEFINFSQAVYDIQTTSDNGMLIVGSAGPFSVDTENHLSYIIKLNEQGEEEWRYLYVRQYMQLNRIFNIEEVEDGYVFLGGDDLTESIWLVKINKKGLFTTATEEPEGLIKPEFFLQLYPNPLSNELNIIAQNPINGNISIYNVQGQIVYQENVTSNNSYKFNLEQLSSGIYFLRYSDQKLNKIQTHKFIKN